MNAKRPKITSSSASTANLVRVKSSNSVSTLDSDELEWSFAHINEEYPRCEDFNVDEFLESDECIEILKTVEQGPVRPFQASMDPFDRAKACSPSSADSDYRKRSWNGMSKVVATKKRKRAIGTRVSRRTKKPHGLPKRPLSAYNIFFKEERVRIFQESELTKARISFEELGRMIGHRWQSLDEEGRKKYQELAEKDVIRYQKEIFAFNEKMCQNNSRRVSKSPNSMQQNVKECISSTEPSRIVAKSPITRTVTLDGSPKSSLESPIEACPCLPLPQASITSKKDVYVDPSSNHGLTACCVQPKIEVKLSKFTIPHASRQWAGSESMKYSCSGSSDHPIDVGSSSMPTNFNECNRHRDYQGYVSYWSSIGSRESCIRSYQYPPTMGTIYPLGGIVSIPHPETKVERIYNVDYQCFRMTRKEFDSYMERCSQDSHEKGRAKMKIHNEVLRAPTPPGTEIKNLPIKW